jgi:hypothetical protein
MVLWRRQQIPNPNGLQNLALDAVASASSSGVSEITGQQTSPSNVNDGTMNAWVSNGGGKTTLPFSSEAPLFDVAVHLGPGEFVTLQWPSPIAANLVYLYDYGDLADQVASCKLHFGDGTDVSFGALNNDGTASFLRVSALVLIRPISML